LEFERPKNQKRAKIGTFVLFEKVKIIDKNIKLLDYFEKTRKKTIICPKKAEISLK
jgi:hypothetical protein